MRKTGIALTVIGAAAFAALLAWGFTSGAAQAQDGTATPTPSPTATPAEFCAPEIPATYEGLATVGGAPAPDGTVITAVIDGVVWGTDKDGTSAGRYVLDVPDHLPAAPPCFPRGTITFKCDGATAADTATWNNSSPHFAFNLTCGAIATATPAATASPTVTATVTVTTTATPAATGTPKAAPPTGGGPGEGGSFQWWPLALAAAALTAVAGLYTARRATR